MASRSRPEIGRGVLRTILPYGLILLAAISFTWGSRMNHHRRSRDLAGREVALRVEITALEEEVGLLKRRIHAIENDPFIIEMQVRERFGLLRPGEIEIHPHPSR